MTSDNQMKAGDLPGLQHWTGRANSWGPDDRWRMWLGGDVVEGVCGLLDDAIASNKRVRSRHHWWMGAIAISPWFTHRGIADRLTQLPACVVIDKKHVGSEAWRLAKRGTPLPSVHPALWFQVPRDQLDEDHALGRPDYDVGPVRVFGWSTENSALVHAKVLLLGRFLWYEDDEEYMGDRWLFTPTSVWWGSANLTEGSKRHLEVACWSDDRRLVEHFSEFVGNVLVKSEPIGSTSSIPDPDLVEVDADWEPDFDDWGD